MTSSCSVPHWTNTFNTYRIIFSKLRAHHLYTKPAKCSFAEKSVHYLGHVIDENGTHPDPKRSKRGVIGLGRPPSSNSDPEELNLELS